MDPGRDETPIGPEPDLNALERQLLALRPSAVAIDRDRMLYESGRAAALASSRRWRTAAAALAMIAIGLGGLLTREQSQLARERSHRIELESSLASRPSAPATIDLAPVPPPSPPDPSSYLALSAHLSEGDLDADRRSTPPSTSLDPPGRDGRPAPLRARDISRALEL